MIKNRSQKSQVVVILGPTASGKTKLAAKLANRFNGEIISADSRQVYRGMDIGTGKDLVDYQVGGKNIPYHLIDVVSPQTEFNAAKYQQLAYRALEDILSRGRVPFLVGGTGLYLEAVISGYDFFSSGGSARQLKAVRQRLNKLSLAQLLARLKKINFPAYQKIDQKNRRRVQRAVENYYLAGKNKTESAGKKNPPYDFLLLGLGQSLPAVYAKIDRRLADRVEAGLVKEIKKLHRQGVSWKRLEEFGLEYRYVSRYCRGLITEGEMLEQLRLAIHHFAKRQMTWFKRNRQIVWLNNFTQAKAEIKSFLKPS